MQPEDLSPSPRIRTTATSYLVRPAPLYESDADTVQFPGDPNAVRRRLAEALWPVGLTQQPRHVSVGGARPLVRIQPSPRVAQIPWELLAVDEETDIRLIDELRRRMTTDPRRPLAPAAAACYRLFPARTGASV